MAYGGTQLVRTHDGEVVADLDIRDLVTRAWFAPGDEYVVVRSQNGLSSAGIFETDGGALVNLMESPHIGFGLDFSDDLEYLVSGTPTGLVSIFDFGRLIQGTSAEDALVRSIPAHDNLIIALQLSPGGSMIVSASFDQPAKLWDFETGRLLSEFGTTARTAVAFHPREPWLYVAEGRSVTIHTLDFDELVAIARDRLFRNFTPEECELYLNRACEVDD